MTLPHQHDIPTNATNYEVALIEKAATEGKIKTWSHHSPGGEYLIDEGIETPWIWLTWVKGCNLVERREVIPTSWIES